MNVNKRRDMWQAPYGSLFCASLAVSYSVYRLVRIVSVICAKAVFYNLPNSDIIIN